MIYSHFAFWLAASTVQGSSVQSLHFVIFGGHLIFHLKWIVRKEVFLIKPKQYMYPDIPVINKWA